MPPRENQAVSRYFPVAVSSPAPLSSSHRFAWSFGPFVKRCGSPNLSNFGAAGSKTCYDVGAMATGTQTNIADQRRRIWRRSSGGKKWVPPLENGDRLTAGEFLRRFEAMPGVKKAELIQGIVHMPSPVRIDYHGEPDSLVQTWLGTYAASTPGVTSATNSTIRLGPDDVPQPDGLLRIRPENGGRSRVGEEGFLEGGPELVFEVAATSSAVDVNDKKTSYRRAGIIEYLVWRTLDEQIDHWRLADDEYIPVEPGEDGVLRSTIFPGLWLDVEAVLDMDGARLLEVLNRGLADESHASFVEKLKSSS